MAGDHGDEPEVWSGKQKHVASHTLNTIKEQFEVRSWVSGAIASLF
jgi:hypothetical protein